MARSRSNKNDTDHIYGLEPTSDEMYELIQKIQEGKATAAEKRLADRHIKRKKKQIRAKHDELIRVQGHKD